MLKLRGFGVICWYSRSSYVHYFMAHIGHRSFHDPCYLAGSAVWLSSDRQSLSDCERFEVLYLVGVSLSTSPPFVTPEARSCEH